MFFNKWAEKGKERVCVMNKDSNQRKIGIRTFAVFIITFLIVTICLLYVDKNQEQEEKLQASYTAEATISRIESQLNQYLAESHLIKSIVENGNDMSADDFKDISSYMQDEQNVIEAHELAKDGVVSQIYPLEGNEEAVGLNMLENPERKKEANLAKDSGQYTIAGPFELVQGGIGSLLFDPIYTSASNDEERQFWGFSILVLNWDNFMDEIKIDKLEDAGYQYQIWKKDLDGGKKIVIAQSSDNMPSDTMEVKCVVPNDTWYFEIIPKKGWISPVQIFVQILIALMAAIAAATAYWQLRMRQYKDRIHALEIEKSAVMARQANEAKTRFLFNMSHDIRTPMNAIIGFSELLEKHHDDPQKVLDYIGKIKLSSSVLLSLINYVLEMARIESGKATLKEEIAYMDELKDILDSVFEPAVDKSGLKYSCDMDVVHNCILCDKTKIREILTNIISNSVKYTPEGGTISVKVKEIAPSDIGYATYRFVVEDNGIGMSEEYLPHIFEEFTREHTSTESKVDGTGLGLPIVKSLVDLMKGTINVESREGQGTKFTIVLSFKLADESLLLKEHYSKESATDDESASASVAATDIKRILLAEDNELNAEIAVTILSENGFTVERAKDGVECIEKLCSNPVSYYDVILMDIQMPNMNGYETTKAIRAMDDKRRMVKIVAMTANAFEEDKKKAFDCGMNGYIAKPVRIEEILKEIEKA